MKKHMIIGLSVALVLAVAWAAFGQATTEKKAEKQAPTQATPPAATQTQPGQGPGQRGGFAQMRENQTKAIASMQEQLGKLKALIEQAPPGRPAEGASQEEMTKMREEFTKRREEQRTIIASIQQELDTLKGARELMTEHNESMASLKELQASAEKEGAKDTVKKIGDMISQRQKQFEDKMAAMGYSPEQMQRFQQRGQGRPQQ
jgi:hypothetical protein